MGVGLQGGTRSRRATRSGIIHVRLYIVSFVLWFGIGGNAAGFAKNKLLLHVQLEMSNLLLVSQILPFVCFLMKGFDFPE